MPPEDPNLMLARLAIEAGFLTREQASACWRRAQATPGTRLIDLLLRERVLTPGQIEHLRNLHTSRQQMAQPGAAADATMLPDGAAASTHFVTAEEAWEEALELDTEVARRLLGRGLVNQERLRVCRQEQIQRHMRLGEILVEKGYVSAAVADAVLDEVLQGSGRRVAPRPPTPAAPPAPPRGGPPAPPARPQAPSAPLAPQGRPTAPIPPRVREGVAARVEPAPPAAPAPAGMPRLEVPLDEPPAAPPRPAPPKRGESGRRQGWSGPLLGVPPGGLGGAEQDHTATVLHRPTNLSLDELNPFALMEKLGGATERMPGRPDAREASSDNELNAFDGPQPNLGLSMDELNVFAAMDDPGDSKAMTREGEPDLATWGTPQSRRPDSDDDERARAVAALGLSDSGSGDPGGAGGAGGAPGGAAFGGGFSAGAVESEASGRGFGDYGGSDAFRFNETPPRAPLPGRANPAEGAEHVPAPRAPQGRSNLVRPPKKKRSRGLVVALILLLLILVCGGGGAAWYFLYGPGAAQTGGG